MKIIYESENVKHDDKYGIGLGNFDGVHRAHEFLLTELVIECNKRGIKSMVYTFIEHPGNLLQGKKIKLISPLERKIERFRKLGIDCLCLVEFNREYADIDAKDFIKNILLHKCNMQLVVTGFNYKFGKDGEGNTDLLKRYGEKYLFDVVIVPPVMIGNRIISSTLIRERINEGNMESVANMLGTYYSIRGTVEYGNKIGTEIGFPTANLIPVKDFALPKSGVYFTRTRLGENVYNSITNIGIQPTVSMEKRTVIETHIFGFSGWLYGKEIEVQFIKRIRNEEKFPDVESLKKQILTDIADVRRLF